MPKSLILLTAAAAIFAAEPPRPKILGIGHMALYVSDLSKARAFYKDLLGYGEPFALQRKTGEDRIVFIKIGEDQYLELFTDEPKQDGQLNHISFYTDNAKAMRDYLAAKGVKVPDTVPKGQIRNSNFNIVDPDGHTVEIVQYEPDSWTRRETGKFLPATRISPRIMHLGVTIASLAPAMKFYGEILGFREIWRGSSSGRELSWVNMQVPDGDDYLEFMLYSKDPDPRRRGVMNHICLMTPDIAKSVAALNSRPARKSYSEEIEIKVGRNGKRQANLFDPDGTRVELMEPHTADGKPVPPSTAPAPR